MTTHDANGPFRRRSKENPESTYPHQSARPPTGVLARLLGLFRRKPKTVAAVPSAPSGAIASLLASVEFTRLCDASEAIDEARAMIYATASAPPRGNRAFVETESGHTILAEVLPCLHGAEASLRLARMELLSSPAPEWIGPELAHEAEKVVGHVRRLLACAERQMREP